MVHYDNRATARRLIIWSIQGVLALAFGFGGFLKAFGDLGELAETIPWIPDVPSGLVRFIGVSQFLASLGLILPSLLRFAHRIPVLAASGLAFVMASASIFHLLRGELSAVSITLILMTLATIVAYERFRSLAPVAPSTPEAERSIS